jgi:hypothetical protein
MLPIAQTVSSFLPVARLVARSFFPIMIPKKKPSKQDRKMQPRQNENSSRDASKAEEKKKLSPGPS